MASNIPSLFLVLLANDMLLELLHLFLDFLKVIYLRFFLDFWIIYPGLRFMFVRVFFANFVWYFNSIFYCIMIINIFYFLNRLVFQKIYSNLKFIIFNFLHQEILNLYFLVKY